jgi:hypothetical protein
MAHNMKIPGKQETFRAQPVAPTNGRNGDDKRSNRDDGWQISRNTSTCISEPILEIRPKSAS